MIGLKQLVGILATIVVLASSAMIHPGEESDGTVALKTMPGGATHLVADAPAPLTIEDLHVFQFSTSEGTATAPAVMEGGFGEVRLLTATTKGPAKLRLGTERVDIPPGSQVVLEGVDGVLDLAEGDLTTIIRATGVATDVRVDPPRGQQVSTVAERPSGIQATSIVVDGRSVSGSMRDAGTFDKVTAKLLGHGQEDQAPAQMLVGNGLFPINESVPLELVNYVGIVITVNAAPDGVLLKLEGYANVTLGGQTFIDQEVSHQVGADLDDKVPKNHEPEANFTWRPTFPNVGEEVEFVDRSRDPGGFVFSWHWDFGDGASSSRQHPTHVYQDPGEYLVTLTVRDVQGEKDTVTHLVPVKNAPPEIQISFTPNLPVEEENTTFQARVEDPDGGPTGEVRWVFDDGLILHGPEVTRAFPAEGNYSVTASVEDDEGATGTANATVAVANAPPVPSFELDPPKPVAGELATLRSTSTDVAGGQIINTSWRISGLEGTFYGEEIEVAFPRDGDVPVELTVTDDDGDSATLKEPVRIANPPPSVHSTRTPAYPNPNATVTFVAQVEDDDQPRSAVWTFPGGIQRSGLAVNHAFSQGGLYNVSVVVEDTDGATGEAAREIAVNHAPIITIDQDDTVVHTGQELDLEAQVTDPDGNATTVAWVVDGQPATNGTVLTFVQDDDGQYNVRATAIDENGAIARAITTVQVLNRPPQLAPDVLAGVVNVDEEVTMVANATDPDGTVESVIWTEGNTTLGTGQQIDVTFTTPGTHRITVNATDDDGASRQQSFDIVVNAPPDLSATVTPQQADAGETLQFDADVDDPENDAVTVTWTFGDGTSPVVQATTQHAYAEAGTYTAVVTAVDEHGAQARASFRLTISTPELDTELTISPSDPRDGDTVHFQVDVPTGRQVEAITWTFGDGTVTTTDPGVTSIDHVYETPETFEVRVVIEADHGSRATHTESLRVTGSYDHEVVFGPRLPDGQCMDLGHGQVSIRSTNTVTGTTVRLPQDASPSSPAWTIGGQCTIQYTFPAGTWSADDAISTIGSVGQGIHIFPQLNFSLSGQLIRDPVVFTSASLAFQDVGTVPSDGALLGEGSTNDTVYEDPTQEVRLTALVTWAEGTPVSTWKIDLDVTYRGPVVGPQVTYFAWTAETNSHGELETVVPMPVLHADPGGEPEIPVGQANDANNAVYLPGQYEVGATAASGTEHATGQALFIEDPQGFMEMLGVR